MLAQNKARARVKNVHLARLSTKLLIAMAQGGQVCDGDAMAAWRLAEEWYSEAEDRFRRDPIPMEEE